MNIIKQIKYNNLTARIFNDFRNPRRDYNSYGKIIVDNSQFNQHNILTEENYTQYSFSINDVNLLNKNYSLYLPLYNENNNLYVKKQISFNNQNQIGWYVLSEQSLHSYLKYNNILIITDQIFNQLKNKLCNEIQLFNAYKNKNLFCYEIIDNENNILMSSGLIIGLQNTINICQTYFKNNNCVLNID